MRPAAPASEPIRPASTTKCLAVLHGIVRSHVTYFTRMQSALFPDQHAITESGIVRAPNSFPLEPMSVELQCPAVLGDGTHDLISRALWKFRCDLEPDGHVGADLANEMRDYLFGNSAGV